MLSHLTIGLTVADRTTSISMQPAAVSWQWTAHAARRPTRQGYEFCERDL